MKLWSWIAILSIPVAFISSINASEVRYPNQKLIETKEAEYSLLWSYSIKSEFRAVSMTPDTKYIAAGAYSGSNDSNRGIYLLNNKGELLWSRKIEGGVKAISISPDGSCIAVGGGIYYYPDKTDHLIPGGVDNSIYLFDSKGKLLWKYETEYSVWGSIRDVSVSFNCSYIALAFLNKVYLFNREGKILWKYNGSGEVADVSISYDGSYLAIISGYKIYLFNKEGSLWSYDVKNLSAPSSTPNPPPWGILDVSISSNGSYILVGAYPGDIYLFNKDGKPLWGIYMEFGNPSVSISSDGSYAVAAIWNTIYFFSNSTQAPKTSGESEQIEIEETITHESIELNTSEIENLSSKTEEVFKADNYTEVKTLDEKANTSEKQIYAGGIIFLIALISVWKGAKWYFAKRRERMKE